MMMDLPYSVDELVEATKLTVREHGTARRATSGRSRTTATARWVSTRCRARSTSPSRAGRGAPTSATTRVTKGVRMKISSWTRHDHNTMPPAAKTTGNYVNSSLAKVEALKAGLRRGDHAEPARASCPSAPARTSSSRATARSSRRRSTSGALEGITQDSVMTIARDLGFDVRVDELDPQRPVHRRGDVRVRHRGRGERGELGRRPPDPVPGPDDARRSRTSTRGPSAARSTGTRTGSNMSSDRRTAGPTGAVEIFDTTLRDGVAARGHLAHRRRQAAHRRAARPSRRALHRGRLARRQPEGRGVLPPRAAPSCDLDDVDARRVRLDPPACKGKVDVDATLAASGEGRHLDGVHRRQGVGLPRHRGAADDPRRGRRHGRRLGRVPQGRRPARDARRRALLRRLQAQPRVRARACSKRPRPRVRLPRAVRHQRRLAAVRGRAASSARSSTTSAAT